MHLYFKMRYPCMDAIFWNMITTTATTTIQPFVPSELGQARDETQKTQKSWFRHVDSYSPSAPIQSYLLEIFQSLRSLLTDSSQVGLGLPLPLFTLSTRFRTPLRSGASEGLRWTCLNNLNRCWVSFSSICATPTLSRITSFRTLSLLVCPQNHRNICISATLSCWICRLFVGQHSAPYNIAGRIAVLQNLPFSFCGTLLS